MPLLYVLDVSEFASLVSYAEADKSLSVSRSGVYYRIESDNDIVIQRADTDMGEAVWFGALVGGFEGRLIEFTEHILRIGKED